MKVVRYFALRELFILATILPGVVSVGYGRVIYVDDDSNGLNDGSSWVNAYKYLQDALADANSTQKPVEIRVAQGIYKPDQRAGISAGDRTATFQLKNDVAIKGGYAGYSEPDPNARDIDEYETILSGDLAGDDSNIVDVNEPSRAENSYHVIMASNTFESAILDGFTITGGNANGTYPADQGAGMLTYDSRPTLSNCTFRRNSAVGNGGGIFSRLIWGSMGPSVTNCVFEANKGLYGAGMCNNSGTSRLSNCTFKQNWACRGGGIYNSDSSWLTNCRFIGNWADENGAGMCEWGSESILKNCIFSGNSAKERGGGIYNLSGSIRLINCTIANNRVNEYGGGIYCYLGDVTLTNCILWTNSALAGNEIAVLGGDRRSGCPLVSVLYCNVQGEQTGVYVNINPECTDYGLRWGNGNIDVDPCFADTLNSDYHLKSQAGRCDSKTQTWMRDSITSPCIDAGDPMSPIGLEPFPNGGQINMGAYGGTAEASKSYFGITPCGVIVAGDINGDCRVDFADLAIMATHWLQKMQAGR